jgi:hypothetical protein
MNAALKSRLIDIRRVLEGLSDHAIGFLAPPSLRHSFPEEVPTAYQEFLREVDGAVCGVVMLYESDDLLQKQRLAKEAPGGKQRWFCFGSVEDYPLLLDRQTGAVNLISPDEQVDFGESLGDLDYFLLTCVFGPEYADFVVDPEEDGWYQLVKS